LGFSSFESVRAGQLGKEAVFKLSIPYWDFLVLNQGSEPETAEWFSIFFQFPIGIF